MFSALPARLLAAVFSLAAVLAQPVDREMYARIRAEAQDRSKIMEYASELMDGIGPRLTGSPNLKKAESWAVEQLRKMGAPMFAPKAGDNSGSAGGSGASGCA